MTILPAGFYIAWLVPTFQMLPYAVEKPVETPNCGVIELGKPLDPSCLIYPYDLHVQNNAGPVLR